VAGAKAFGYELPVSGNANITWVATGTNNLKAYK
jgi:hypothetical protein